MRAAELLSNVVGRMEDVFQQRRQWEEEYLALRREDGVVVGLVALTDDERAQQTCTCGLADRLRTLLPSLSDTAGGTPLPARRTEPPA